MFLSIISHNWKAAKTQNFTKIIQDPRLFFSASRGFRSPQKTNKQHALKNNIYHYIYIYHNTYIVYTSCMSFGNLRPLARFLGSEDIYICIYIYNVAKPKLKGGTPFHPLVNHRCPYKQIAIWGYARFPFLSKDKLRCSISKAISHPLCFIYTRYRDVRTSHRGFLSVIGVPLVLIH